MYILHLSTYPLTLKCEQSLKVHYNQHKLVSTKIVCSVQHRKFLKDKLDENHKKGSCLLKLLCIASICKFDSYTLAFKPSQGSSHSPANRCMETNAAPQSYSCHVGINGAMKFCKMGKANQGNFPLHCAA